MLKRRIIPIELLHKGRLVKTVKFGKFRDVGDPLKSSKVYSDQDADELILLNIDRNNRSVQVTASYLSKITKKCFMPIAAGGGIRTVKDAQLLFNSGADKIIVNTAAYYNASLLTEIIDRWGSQSLVVSVDVFQLPNRQYVTRSECGMKDEKVDLIEYVKFINKIGVGEIMINSINNDGMMKGYDLDLLEIILGACNVPIIFCGGAGCFVDLKNAIELGASAVACGSLFNFGDNNPLRAKAFLKNYEIPLKIV